MHTSDLPGIIWHKSSRSGEQGECVEVARLHTTHLIRDSKNPTGPILTFEHDAFRRLTTEIRDGRHTTP
jgi:Domain of unknown function (DUF397)